MGMFGKSDREYEKERAEKEKREDAMRWQAQQRRAQMLKDENDYLEELRIGRRNAR